MMKLWRRWLAWVRSLSRPVRIGCIRVVNGKLVGRRIPDDEK